MAGVRPFSPIEWFVAWRYLNSRKSDGGVSGMTIISLVGVTIAVFAMIATLSVRSGFRTEFVDTVLGANPHLTLYSYRQTDANQEWSTAIYDYEELATDLSSVDGVVQVIPLVRSQLLASSEVRNTGIEVFGIAIDDIKSFPLINEPVSSAGNLDDLAGGIAIGSGVARTLGVGVGDMIRLTSPNGARTVFGLTPRINQYPVAYVFEVGRYDIDQTRAYLDFEEGQKFLNRDGAADELAIFIETPDAVEAAQKSIEIEAGPQYYTWSWKDSSGAFLQALRMEDNLMFIVMSILVLVATFNIVSGLVMLVKNKLGDIGILRSIGFSQGSIMRIFVIYGAIIGTVGTISGVILGCLFAIYIDPIFDAVNYLAGGNAWDPSVRFLSSLPAQIKFWDVMSVVLLSLGLSYGITIIPARRAAKMYPGEAIRYG